MLEQESALAVLVVGESWGNEEIGDVSSSATAYDRSQRLCAAWSTVGELAAGCQDRDHGGSLS